eukprot:3397970-Amphidinium_carterae.1
MQHCQEMLELFKQEEVVIGFSKKRPGDLSTVRKRVFNIPNTWGQSRAMHPARPCALAASSVGAKYISTCQDMKTPKSNKAEAVPVQAKDM